VDDDVGAPIDRPGEDRGEGVVDDDGILCLWAMAAMPSKSGTSRRGVADRLEVDGLGPGVDRLLELGELGAVDEAEVDAVLGRVYWKRLYVPPYSDALVTMLSPARAS